MHQHGTVGAEFVLDAVEPQHRPALGFGDRLPPLAAIDIFAGGIDCARTALRFLPIVLEGTATPELRRLVDLTMRMQAAERVVADRAQRDDLSLGSSASGSSISMAATSALYGKSCERRSCALPGG